MKKIHAIIYTRVGTESNGHSKNQLRQLQLCRNYIYEKEYILEEGAEFSDKCSGLAVYTKYRALHEALAYVDKHPDRKFVLIATDLLRLSRNRDVLLSFIYDFFVRGVYVELTNDINVYAKK